LSRDWRADVRVIRAIAAVGLLQTMPAFYACAAPAVTAYHIVLSRRALAAGEQIEVRLEPPPPRGTLVDWDGAKRGGADLSSPYSRQAVYTAPFVIPAGTSPAVIRARLSGSEVGRISIVDNVELLPSAVPGTDDCLGPGQTFSTVEGTVVPDWNQAPRLEGVVVNMGDPEYPRGAANRGLTGMIPLRALICRTGHALVAYLETSYDDKMDPIEPDRELANAALAIVRARSFTPLKQGGAEVAGWIEVLVSFRQ
jgi:hypothetical protein